MSQYYQVHDQVLWNPSNGVFALFMRSAQALAPEAGLPTGLGPMRSDECQIDLKAFTAFVSALVERYERTNHPILHALMEGFIATALVLVQRGGAELDRSEREDSDGRREVQVSGPSTSLPEGGGGTAGRWAELSARHARAMPR
ncbi:DUF6086 family protein [Nonomuraea jiangxiensis]|uniref:Uncharacterized protein n=1 Tax=Nonomuraea jiangxiensis TaxID=633440 RepID=A0A1G9BYN5_9ACTN|nr:DUF6086 family protein [Nonomuraea jiangxiensis]SDK44548.1 hypothetical protein SAMN05421869_11617 [Nonomuraea jiangxiensis]